MTVLSLLLAIPHRLLINCLSLKSTLPSSYLILPLCHLLPWQYQHHFLPLPYRTKTATTKREVSGVACSRTRHPDRCWTGNAPPHSDESLDSELGRWTFVLPQFWTDE